ncbi:MauE/DoxX family redox-associated membrane protein [Pedobacter nutrimenti]|uniref:MauE/DoxX family redox-associated membrane protein n=1 Tax=Pedobacter nutrimenti TaxID=1241337 RepID=UPI00292D607B|nr:MauE/DoxX family redox-associated membrane protein [Pedobacter nutrimenti]
MNSKKMNFISDCCFKILANRGKIGRGVIVEVISGLFFLLFLYAATSKLMDYDKFQIQIGKSPILTDFAGVLVWLVPAVEIGVCLLLIFPRTIMLGLYGCLLLMAMFTAYIIAILNFSDSIPCSCGGVLAAMSWEQHLVFNVVFLVLAIVGILLQSKVVENKTL